MFLCYFKLIHYLIAYYSLKHKAWEILKLEIQEIKENAKFIILKWGFTTIRFNVKIIYIFKLIFLHGCLKPCFQTRE